MGSGADERILGVGEGARGGPVRVLRAALTGLAVAAPFTSAALLRWAENWPDGAAAAVLTHVAQGWDAAMSAAGASGPPAWLHGVVRALEAATFGG